MQTVEIPREAWSNQLDEFTARHEGWLASLDVLNARIGAQVEIDNLPLLGISVDRMNYEGTIAISLAQSAAEHMTHVIHAVRHIYVEGDEGPESAMLIESMDGTRVILQLHAADMQGSDSARSQAETEIGNLRYRPSYAPASRHSERMRERRK